MTLRHAIAEALQEKAMYPTTLGLHDLEYRVAQESFACQMMARDLDTMLLAERNIQGIILTTSQESFSHREVVAIHQQMAHLGLEDLSQASLEGLGDAWQAAIKLLKALIAGIVKAAKAFYARIASFIQRVGEFLFGMKRKVGALDAKLQKDYEAMFDEVEIRSGGEPEKFTQSGHGAPEGWGHAKVDHGYSNEAAAAPKLPPPHQRVKAAVFRVTPEDFSYLFIEGKFAGHNLDPIRNMNKLVMVDYLAKVREVLKHVAGEIKVDNHGEVQGYDDLITDTHELLSYIPHSLPMHKTDAGKNIYTSTFSIHGDIRFSLQLPDPTPGKHWWNEPINAHLKPPAVSERGKALPPEHKLPKTTAQELRKHLDSTARCLTGVEAALTNAKNTMSVAEDISGKLYATINNLQHKQGDASHTTHQIRSVAQMVQALRTKLLVPILDVNQITRILHLMIRVVAIREQTKRPFA